MAAGSSLEAPLAGGGARARRCLSWEAVFYVNVFFACTSFSIVMPSLFIYLDSLGASTAFYAAVVATFSVGEAAGSLVLGGLSTRIGTKRTMQACAVCSFLGSNSYALADAVSRTLSPAAAPYLVLVGRMLQGTGSGGQQAAEQAYMSIAAPIEQRTTLTGRLSTFACTGFIFGPAVGALVASVVPDARLGALRLNVFTKCGYFVALLDATRFTITTCCFTEARAAVPADDVENGRASTKALSHTERAVWALIGFFFVHFNGFALQETVTTPLVQQWFGWDEVEANLLFTAAGLANMLCSVAMSMLAGSRTLPDGSVAQVVEDRHLLMGSLLVGLVGWLVMIPPGEWLRPFGGAPGGGGAIGLVQFGVGFCLVTVAFPFGRGVCLAMVGKLLDDAQQGQWMGIMFAFGAIARIAGPFWAVAGCDLFGTWAVFGSSAFLFALSIACAHATWPILVPPSAGPSTPQTATPSPAGPITPSRWAAQLSRSISKNLSKLTPTLGVSSAYHVPLEAYEAVSPVKRRSPSKLAKKFSLENEYNPPKPVRAGLTMLK
jgi:MFS family permease